MPTFNANSTQIVRGPGLISGSIYLRDFTVATRLTARLDLSTSALSARVSSVIVSESVVVGVDDYPDGDPVEITEEQTVAQSDGITPVTVKPNQNVTIYLNVDGVASEFDEAQGQLIVNADNWDPISIAITFVGARDARPTIDTVVAIIRQGKSVKLKMPVQWVEGATSEVYCSLGSPTIVSSERISVYSNLDLTSPITQVRPGEETEVGFELDVAKECPVGFRHIRAGLVVYGMQVHSFTIDLHVLPAPPPPAPSPDYEYGIGWGYTLIRKENSFIVRRNDELVAKASVPTEKLNESQSNAVLTKVGADVKDFFERNLSGISSGRITAAEIGGVVYYCTTVAAVSVVFGPVGGVLAPLAGRVGRNIGEFYGSIVDDVVAIIKREDRPSIYEAVGTLATVYFTVVSPIVPAAGAARFLGAKGWDFTREVGRRLGGELEASVNEIESIASDIGGGIENIGDAFGDAVAWVGDIFGL